MKFAILADIHANLEALQAVLGDAQTQRCTHYAFLGDFVGYCADPKACLDIVRAMKAPCVKGTHVPVAFIRDTVTRGGTYTKLKVEPGKKYFVSPGAVGQPRDNNPQAAYAIYNLDEGTVELRRVAYDIQTTMKKIRDSGLI